MARSVYQLAGQKMSGNIGYRTTGEHSKPFPYNRSLALYHRIIEEEKDINGVSRKVVKRVGYSPNENTIYIDQFLDPQSKLEKIRFKNGYCLADDEREPQKKLLLDLLDINGSKKGRDAKVTAKYIRVDRNEKAETILRHEESIIKELSIFWELPHEKIRAIANSIGLSTYGVEPAIWKYHLLEWAKINLTKFKEAYQDPELDYIDTISRAEELGLLKFDLQTWKFNEVPIMKVSINKNKYKELTAYMMNQPQWANTISNEVAVKEGKSLRTIGEDKTSFDFTDMNGEDLLRLSIEHGVMVYRTGHGYKIVNTDYQVGGISKKSAVAAIESEDVVRQQIIAQLNMI